MSKCHIVEITLKVGLEIEDTCMAIIAYTQHVLDMADLFGTYANGKVG